MKKKIILALLFLGGLILVLVWMQGGFHSKVGGGRSPLPENTDPKPSTITVEPTRTKGEVTVPGSVISRETARLAARAQGYVIELNADAGDTVKQGDVLLRLDNQETAERLDQAKAALESAKADLIEAEKNYERYKSLYEKESVAQKAFDEAKARYEMTKAAKERAESAVEEARTMLSYGVVTAPFDGIISERNVNMGDLVNPGMTLFLLYKPGTSELVAQAGEQYVPYLKTGTEVEVKIPSIGLEQTSNIREVVPQKDVRTRTVTVKVPLKDVEGLAPGLYGTMVFDTEAGEVITVPKHAVRTVGQLESVRVLENGSVKVRHVKTGRELNDRIEILSGLKKGEKVVVE
jgi:RND family efflux transporter MFP subunit